MNTSIEVGKINNLKIERFTEFGIFLVPIDGESILLPNIYVTEEMELSQRIDVFVYSDSEDRIVATTLKPAGMVGDFVALKVIDSTKYGAFLDWGLAKDLLVPKKFQKTIHKVGEIKVIRIMEDVEYSRIFGTEKFSEFFSKNVWDLKRNQEVFLMVFHKTPMGYKVLVSENKQDFKFEGMLFENEVFQTLEIGQKLTGYIKQVRDDGKIDISLQPIGNKSTKINKNKVLGVLEKNGGSLDFTYKSDAEDISETFGISKKSFKKILTELIEKKLIKLGSENIQLIK